MFGGNLHGDNFMKKMGAAGLHPFVEGFRSQGIQKMSHLQAKPISEIRKIGKTINMPDAAVDRLLEVLGKQQKKEFGASFKKVEKSKTTAKNGGATKAKKSTVKPAPAKPVTAKPATAPPPKETEPSKVDESSYYHFSSTPAEKARQFDAKVVHDASTVDWKSSKGASSWNPGNTFEDRDFSDQAKAMMKHLLTDFELADNIKITNIKKTGGDLTVISARGKVKCVYDLSFESEWEANFGGQKLKGKLDIQDIMPDDDDWYIKCSTSKRDETHNLAKKLVMNGLIDNLNRNCFKIIMEHYLSKVGK